MTKTIAPAILIAMVLVIAMFAFVPGDTVYAPHPCNEPPVATHVCTPVDVDIDIKPGSFPSSVDCNENKPVPVAVFGSESFDATDIDPASLKLNGVATPEIHNKVHIEDKNKDGMPDAVLHLDRVQVCSTLDPNPDKLTVEATLTGKTTDDPPIKFEGTGDIRPINS